MPVVDADLIPQLCQRVLQLESTVKRLQCRLELDSFDRRIENIDRSLPQAAHYTDNDPKFVELAVERMKLQVQRDSLAQDIQLSEQSLVRRPPSKVNVRSPPPAALGYGSATAKGYLRETAIQNRNTHHYGLDSSTLRQPREDLATKAAVEHKRKRSEPDYVDKADEESQSEDGTQTADHPSIQDALKAIAEYLAFDRHARSEKGTIDWKRLAAKHPGPDNKWWSHLYHHRTAEVQNLMAKIRPGAESLTSEKASGSARMPSSVLWEERTLATPNYSFTAE